MARRTTDAGPRVHMNLLTSTHSTIKVRRSQPFLHFSLDIVPNFFWFYSIHFLPHLNIRFCVRSCVCSFCVFKIVSLKKTLKTSHSSIVNISTQRTTKKILIFHHFHFSLLDYSSVPHNSKQNIFYCWPKLNRNPKRMLKTAKLSKSIFSLWERKSIAWTMKIISFILCVVKFFRYEIREIRRTFVEASNQTKRRHEHEWNAIAWNLQGKQAEKKLPNAQIQ